MLSKALRAGRHGAQIIVVLDAGKDKFSPFAASRGPRAAAAKPRNHFCFRGRGWGP
jgi:hypothetical protein